MLLCLFQMGVAVGTATRSQLSGLVARHHQGGIEGSVLPVARHLRLLSACSGHFLQIVDKSVNAKANLDSPFG